QAPTLIGCKFLKIVRENHRRTALLPGVFCVAASAAEKRDYEDSFSLRQPLFSLTARKSCRLRKPPVPAAAFAVRMSGTSNGEGGES
ncbi:hypothetical protein, partial [Paraburkholderia silvatlantica]|uniref:hypothetical protein n=1 Tax=Paraburkholderia silvatlantica TaxID=321895 RepID=UPI003752C9A5